MLSWSAPVAKYMVENPDFHIWITSEMFGWIAGIMALGGVFSSLISGYLRNILGTKITIVISNIPIIIGHILLIFAFNFSMVIFFEYNSLYKIIKIYYSYYQVDF